MAREFFKCFHNYRKKIEKLSDQEVGRLFRALMEYSECGTAPELTGRESIAFDFIAEDIDRDSAAYSQKCKVNAENGSLGGKRTQANGSERKRSEAKSSESDKIEDIRDKTIKEIPTNVGTKKSSAFHAPTVEEVRAYCQERNNGIDPEAFVNYYENRGWYLSKGIKMRDWKRAVITWEKNGFDKPKKQNAALKYEQKPISKTDFDALVVNFEEEDT
jgi:hypothetical protein